MLKQKFAKPILIAMSIFLTACGGGGGSSNSTTSNIVSNDGINRLPIVDAGYDRKVQVNTPVKLYGTATDIDGTISSYEWKIGNEVLGNTQEITYTPTKLGIYTITLTVIDNDGGVATDTIKLEVVEEAVYEEPLPF